MMSLKRPAAGGESRTVLRMSSFLFIIGGKAAEIQAGRLHRGQYRTAENR